MARVQKFWNDFLAKPDALQKSQSFPLLLWQGITESARPRVWAQAGSKFAAAPEGGVSELPRGLRDEILANVEVELEQAHFTGLTVRLGDEKVQQIQNIILRHAQRNSLKAYDQGSASLAAIVLSVVREVDVAVTVMQAIGERLRKYHANSNAKLLDDVLVLSDVMTQELPDLCDHLNTCNFDVVDLSDIVVTWATSVCASYFPSQVVVRVLDILLFEGCECMMGVFFGLFKSFAGVIIEQKREDIFQFITNLPGVMHEQKIQNAMKTGYETFRVGAKRIRELRQRKNWLDTLVNPGPVRFVRGVGDPVRSHNKSFQEQLGRALVRGAAVRPSSPSAAEKAAAAPVSITVQSNQTLRLPEVIFSLEKARRQCLDAKLQKLLEEAAKELRRQHESLQSLQIDLKHAEEKMMDHGGSGFQDRSSLDSSYSSVNSDGSSAQDDDDRRHPRRGDGDVLPMGCVKYSKLFQHQQFPCLYMEGYLLKARRKGFLRGSRSTTGVFGNLHRRFFVLQGSFVTYFKSHRNSKPSRDLSVDMRGRTIRKLDRHKFGRYGFEISEVDSDECLYLLFATNADERNVWVQVLHAAAES